MIECYYQWCPNHPKDEPFCCEEKCTQNNQQLNHYAQLRVEQTNAPFDKIQWMEQWCNRHGLELSLYGSCGLGRDCVGIIDQYSQSYPDYHWYDPETYEFIDNNGYVWTPDNAYHKHPCVAVLGHGNESIEQLYEWLQWFDKNGFDVMRTTMNEEMDDIEEVLMLEMLNPNWYKRTRMVKSNV